MKTLFLSLGLALSTLTATAQTSTFSYLTLQRTNGTEQSLMLDNLRITFSGNNLVATNGTETASIPLAEMQKMFFAAKPTAISEAAASEAISATISGGRLTVNAPKGTSVSVFSIDGRRMGTEGLTEGVYLVKVGGRTIKVTGK